MTDETVTLRQLPVEPAERDPFRNLAVLDSAIGIADEDVAADFRSAEEKAQWTRPSERFPDR